jgi:hypothetical protein
MLERRMTMLPTLLLLLSTAAVSPADAAPTAVNIEERQEIYGSLLSCAAFHTIEAARGDELARASQKAAAQDYAQAAKLFSSDGKTATVNRDLGNLLQIFQAQLDAGETRAMAEQWTALERSCADLHPLKDRLIRRARSENAPLIEGER